MYLFELEFSSFPDIHLGVGLLDHMVALFLTFCRASVLFSIIGTSIYIPTNSAGRFPFLHTLKGRGSSSLNEAHSCILGPIRVLAHNRCSLNIS